MAEAALHCVKVTSFRDVSNGRGRRLVLSRADKVRTRHHRRCGKVVKLYYLLVALTISDNFNVSLEIRDNLCLILKMLFNSAGRENMSFPACCAIILIIKKVKVKRLGNETLSL